MSSITHFRAARTAGSSHRSRHSSHRHGGEGGEERTVERGHSTPAATGASADASRPPAVQSGSRRKSPKRHQHHGHHHRHARRDGNGKHGTDRGHGHHHHHHHHGTSGGKRHRKKTHRHSRRRSDGGPNALRQPQGDDGTRVDRLSEAVSGRSTSVAAPATTDEQQRASRSTNSRPASSATASAAAHPATSGGGSQSRGATSVVAPAEQRGALSKWANEVAANLLVKAVKQLPLQGLGLEARHLYPAVESMVNSTCGGKPFPI